MAQMIKNANIFGRIGSGIGQGLAEQVPKEIENYRLRTGLKNIADQSDKGELSPTQLFAQTAGTYGATPQIIQSMGELAQKQGMRNSYKNAANQYRNASQGQQQGQPQEFNSGSIAPPQQEGQNYTPQQQQRGQQQQPGSNESNLVQPNEKGAPQIENKNPTRQEAQPQQRWTAEKNMDELANFSEQFPHASDEQLHKMVADKEARELNRSETERAIDTWKEGNAKKVEDVFQKSLEKVLEKTSEGTFRDISGDLQNTALRTIKRNIAANPKLTVDEAVNDGVQNLLSFAKARNDINGLATISTLSALNPFTSRKHSDQLNSFAHSYDKLDRNEELFDKLRTKSSTTYDDKGNVKTNDIGFDNSPQEAAGRAFPTKKFPEFKNEIKKISQVRPGISVQERLKASDPKKSISYAINSEKYAGNPKFSFLSAARDYAKADENFNQSAFFNQLREDRDQGLITLSPFQNRELNFGEKDLAPTWGDIFFPNYN